MLAAFATFLHALVTAAWAVIATVVIGGTVLWLVIEITHRILLVVGDWLDRRRNQED